MMAAKARISAAILLVCIILPLLASAFLDHLPQVLEHDSSNKDVTIRGDNSIVRANDDNDFTLPRSHEKKNERSLREKKSKKKKHKKKKNKKGKKSHKDKTFDFDHLFEGNQQEGEEFSPYLQPYDVPQTTEEEEEEHAEYDGLREGFYQKTCPQAENIIRNGLIRAFQNDSTIAAAFPRLLLHDCFVNGCDGSILLDTTPSGARVEKLAGTNGATVRGFELIDEIKAELERQCPGIVSCSDILAYLSRDAFVLSGLANYNVLGGRRDGLESNEANIVGNLPLPGDTVDQMIDLFQKKGLNSEDLVVLVGAHSIGVAHCFNFLYRLDEPEKAQMLDPRLAGVMRFMCTNQMNTLPFDPTTQYKMDSIFYKQLMVKKGLIESDQILAQDIRTRGFVQKFGDDEMGWFDKFGKAMNKLGAIEVLTGNQGQIRRQCRAVN